MEDFDTEVNDSVHELNVVRGKERGIFRRSISGGDAGERTGIGFDSIDSSRASLLGNLVHDLSLCENRLERDLRVSIPNQADEEIMELRASTSKVYGDFSDGRSRLHFSEVKQLRRRLQILEEDTETMKKEFFATVDECNQLLNEVSQKLYAVHQHLRIRTRGEMSVHQQLLNESRNMRVGLLQALYQEPNPSLVTRVHKADMFILQDSTGDSSSIVARNSDLWGTAEIPARKWYRTLLTVLGFSKLLVIRAMHLYVATAGAEG